MNDLVGKLLKTEEGRHGLYQAHLLSRWHQVVPELPGFSGEQATAWRTQVRPVKLVRDVLTLSCGSASAAQRVQAGSSQLAGSINTYFGQEVVKGVKVVVGAAGPSSYSTGQPRRTLPPQHFTKAKEKCAHVKDPALRAALARLGGWVLAEE